MRVLFMQLMHSKHNHFQLILSRVFKNLGKIETLPVSIKTNFLFCIFLFFVCFCIKMIDDWNATLKNCFKSYRLEDNRIHIYNAGDVSVPKIDYSFSKLGNRSTEHFSFEIIKSKTKSHQRVRLHIPTFTAFYEWQLGFYKQNTYFRAYIVLICHYNIKIFN